MKYRLLFALVALALFPATASADTSLTRGAFGHGTVVASSATGRPTPPECTTPASTPQSVEADCAPITARSFAQCTQNGGGTGHRCQITLSTQAPAGWRFDHWATGPCAGSAAICTFLTSELSCSGGAEPVCGDENELGPWTVIAVFVDTRAPTLTIGGPAQNAVALDDQGKQTFTFTTDEDDEAPSFQCRLDIGAVSACPNPATLSNLADGEHELCVTPSDASGLVGTQKCRHWDQERPATVRFADTPPAATNRDSASFTYTADKPGVTFECALDGRAFGICPASGQSVAGLGDGQHQFATRAFFHAPLDPPGVTHPGIAATYTWKVDTTPPETTITSGPADGAEIVDVAPTFAFAASEDGAFACAIDGAPAAPCTSPFTTPPLLAGQHTVRVTAIDAVGNADPSPATRTFTLKTGLGTLVDADHDGYPEALDCNDHAANVHPGALEVPGNTVDENCDGVVAPFPRAAAVVAANGSAGPKRTKFTSFVVSAITPGAKVQLRCSGPRKACPFKHRVLKVKKGKASAGRFTAGVGAKLDVVVTAKGFVGKVMRLPVIKNRFARLQTLCLAPGTATKPKRCS
jgi:hypothetical protein